MNKIGFVVSFFILICSLPAFAEQQHQVNSAAIEATENFLLLLDSEDYDAAWEQSSSVLKIIKTKDSWINELKIARELFGYQINRTIKMTREFDRLSGLPDSNFHLTIFSSSFENKKEGTQNIIVKLDNDGKWRVVDYRAS